MLGEPAGAGGDVDGVHSGGPPYPSVPVRVDYQLTPLGHTLLPVVRAIKDWSETHISQVHAARAAYDQATPIR